MFRLSLRDCGKLDDRLPTILPGFPQEVPYAGEDVSRKGAKTQSATAFLTAFFASLRLCARKILPIEVRRRIRALFGQSYSSYR